MDALSRMDSPSFTAPLVREDQIAASSPWVLGVDPGIRGAVAAVRTDLSEVLVLRMPMLQKTLDLRCIADFIGGLRLRAPVRMAVVEKSQVMPRQGAVSGFVYGRSYGSLLAVLELSGVPFAEVSPAAWKQAVIGRSFKASTTGGDASAAAKKKELKELAIATARRMFPSAGPFKKTDDGPAEAVLLAEACRRLVLTGSMKPV